MKQKVIDYDGYYVPYFGELVQKEIDDGWLVKSTFTKTYTSYDGRHGEPVTYTVATVIYENVKGVTIEKRRCQYGS
jgi:hypothetical protein